jgi:peptide/nickel transport system permease protein
MLTYTIKRLIAVIPILLGITAVSYFLTRTIPGDLVAVMLGTNTDPVVAAQLRHKLNLDRPIIEGYVVWLGHLVRGDMGESLRSGRPIGERSDGTDRPIRRSLVRPCWACPRRISGWRSC